MKASYFHDQGLGVFLEKLRAQGWFELFANTQLGCSQPDIAEFYANVSLHGEVISSTVNGVLIEVNAQALGVILGVPAMGFETLPPLEISTGSSAKKPKTVVAPSPKLEKFQNRGVVRGKMVSYFQDQGLEVFLDKMKAQGWYELFTNTQLGFSQLDVAEFYTNVSLHGDVISSKVNGVLVEVNAQALG